jgi:enamine deaminase RidA (YjgF/YER057c/UK114 family)
MDMVRPSRSIDIPEQAGVSTRVNVAETATRNKALACDAYQQTQNILDTIRTTLGQAGARIEDVVRTVITSRTSAIPTSPVHMDVFGSIRPASTAVQVKRVDRPEMQVEMIDGP